MHGAEGTWECVLATLVVLNLATSSTAAARYGSNMCKYFSLIVICSMSIVLSSLLLDTHIIHIFSLVVNN